MVRIAEGGPRLIRLALVALVLASGTLAAQASYPGILYYQFNEGAGSTTANLANPGEGFSAGQFSAAPNWNTTTPRLGAASIDNDGLNRHLDTGWSISERNGGSFTVELWFRTSEGGSPFSILAADGETFAIYLVNGGLTWQVGSNAWGIGGNFANNTWHYTAVAFNSSNNTARFHWNGSNGTVFAGATSFSQRNLQLLHWNGLHNFDGEIDEFRVWNTNRSAAQINGSRNSQLSFYLLQVSGPDGAFIKHNGTMGLVRAPFSPVTHTFTIRNTGTQNINFPGGGAVTIQNAIGCSAVVTSQPGGGPPLGVGQTRTFAIQVTPSAPEFSFDVSVANNRQPSPYVFSVDGLADTGLPEILYYRLNEGTGTSTRNDAVPGLASAPGSFTASPMWNTSDPRLRAASAGTGAGQRLPTGFSAADLPGRGFTVEFWMRSNSTSGTEVLLGDEASFAVSLVDGALTLASGLHVLQASAIVNDSQWRHVALVSNPGNFGARFYVDGVQAGEVVNFSFGFAGEDAVLAANGTALPYGGELDDVRWWAYPRSAAELVADKDHELFGRLDVQRPAVSSILPGGADDVGDEPASAPLVLDYTLRNMGGRDLEFGTPAVAISAEANCTVSVLTQPSGSVLGAAAATAAQLEVTILSPGAFSFTVDFLSDDTDVSAYAVLVSGDGLSDPELQTALGPFDYGAANVGNVSINSPTTHTLTNSGELPLTITDISATGAEFGDWTLLALPAFPAVVAPGGFLQFDGEFVPGGVGLRQAAIRVISDTGGLPGTPVDISVFGTGTQGILSTPLGPVDYGFANVGGTSSNSPITHVVTNTGDGLLTVTAISIIGSHDTDWSPVSLPTLPVLIAPSGTVNVQLQLVPSAAGTRNATLRLTSDTGSAPGSFTDVTLTGEGRQGVLSTPLGPVDYGFANVGEVSGNSPVTHVITNSGDGLLTLTGIAVIGANAADWTDVSLPALPAIIAPSGSVNVELQLTPSATGTRTATLRLTSDSGASPGALTNVALTGEGRQGVLSTNLGPVDYGSSFIGAPSANSPVLHTLNNTGDGTLTVSAIGLIGADAGDWSLTGLPTLPAVIVPSGQLQFTGTLVPSASGARGAFIRVVSDSGSIPAVQTDIEVTGIGIVPTSVTGVQVGADTGGPLRVEATVNGPASTLVDVTVSYSGGSNPGAAYIADAFGFAVSGNQILGVPANSVLHFLWDAYATERHTTDAGYVLALAPSQGSVVGTPGSSTPTTLSRFGGWAQHVEPGAIAPGVYSHTLIFDAANDRMVAFGGRDSTVRRNDVWVFERAGGRDAWRKLSLSGPQPSPRQYAHAIYDAANQRMILHGGLADSGIAGDLWALDLTPGLEGWTQLAPAGTAPAARRNAGFEYDAARNRALLFGGLGAAQYNDVFELDLTPGFEAWSQLTPGGLAPSARFGHAAALDAAGDRMIVVGGRAGTTDLIDIHQLSLSGSGTWSELSPGGALPPVRYFMTHGWDSANRALILQSGYRGSSVERDAWHLDLAGAPLWTQLEPDSSAGTGRVVGGAAFDAARDEMLFYGGIGTAGLTSPAISVFDVSSVQWQAPAGGDAISSEGRWGAVMAWDEANDRVILWGGKDHSTYFGDVWTLDRSTPAGDWAKLTTSTPAPSARVYAAWAMDNGANRLFVHGGGTPAGPTADDLWSLDLSSGAWTQLSTGSGPSARDQHSMVYDSLRNRVIVFGGRAGILSDEVWAFDLGLSSWTQLLPASGPIARHGHGAVYDSVNDRMVVFAGRHPTGLRNDAWALDLTPGLEAWTDISATAGAVPTGRLSFGYATSADGSRVWLHGGDASPPSSELWQLDLSGTEASWTLHAPAGSAPLARFVNSACVTPAGTLYSGFGFLDNKGAADLWSVDTLNVAAGWSQQGGAAPDALVSAAGALDPAGRRLIAFGGLGGSVHQTGLWQLDLNGPVAEWSPLVATGPGPSARRSASMVYDGSASPPRMLMFGGRTAFSHASIVDELWALVLDPGNEHWVQLAAGGAAPPARTNHSAVVDGANRMIVYGGISQSGTTLGDLYALDLGSLNWSQLTPSGTAPLPRYSAAMVYDAPRDRIVFHGGIQVGNLLLGDSWALALSGTPAWSKLTPAGNGPGPLFYAGAVVDPAGERMLMHGGYDTSARSGLYQLDLTSDTWTLLPGTVAQPQARWSHLAVWDAPDARLVIAGGYLQGEVAATQADGRAETWFWGD